MSKCICNSLGCDGPDECCPIHGWPSLVADLREQLAAAQKRIEELESMWHCLRNDIVTAHVRMPTERLGLERVLAHMRWMEQHNRETVPMPPLASKDKGE